MPWIDSAVVANRHVVVKRPQAGEKGEAVDKLVVARVLGRNGHLDETISAGGQSPIVSTRRIAYPGVHELVGE